ncbi:MAG: hypothetical protein AABX47_08665 [Nanoarchaeota archaeon]
MVDTLNWKGLAISFGIVNGVLLFVSALLAWANVSFLWWNAQTFGMLAAWYTVLTPTLAGALFGLVVGALCGALCGWILAGLYNWSSARWG